MIKVREYAEVKNHTDDPELWEKLSESRKMYVCMLNIVLELQALRDEVRTLRGKE